MEQGWTEKDKRQFRHILKNPSNAGKSRESVREMAARTVNKRRRLEGRTENRTTLGTGNPHSMLERRTCKELYNRARQLQIPGRSKLRKRELVEKIRRHG